MDAGTAVFAITGARDARTGGHSRRDEKAALRRLESATGEVPTTNGHRLRDVLQEWTVRKIQADQPGLFSNARTVVLGGSNHRRTARVLSEYTDNIVRRRGTAVRPALDAGLVQRLTTSWV